MRFLLSMILLFAGTTLFLTAQEDTLEFDMQDTPIIMYGARGEWDSRHIGPGAVNYHDGQFHMFRNGYRGWPLPSQVAYHTSDDGVNWVEVQDTPVFYHEQLPFDVDLALLTSALVEDDGTWVFYFSLYPDPDNGNRPTGIVRATADSPTSEWTMDDTIVLTTGNEGAWDANFIGLSTVLRTDDGYVMYYSGDDGETWAIGMATSDDGINWTKYDNPETTDTLYAESDPVFTQESDWEVNVQDPRVVQTDDGYAMLYSSFNNNWANQGYNIAVSQDGVTWERVQDSPMIPRSAFRRNPWYPSLAHHDNTFFAYLEIDSRAGTDIFVGTYEGSFAND